MPSCRIKKKKKRGVLMGLISAFNGFCGGFVKNNNNNNNHFDESVKVFIRLKTKKRKKNHQKKRERGMNDE